MINVRRVVGASMLPAFTEGQIVVAFKYLKAREGKVVIARVNGREVIKRVVEVSGKTINLAGDNANFSTDSRQWGRVNQKNILGVVVYPRSKVAKFKQKAKTGR